MDYILNFLCYLGLHNWVCSVEVVEDGYKDIKFCASCGKCSVKYSSRR